MAPACPRLPVIKMQKTPELALITPDQPLTASDYRWMKGQNEPAGVKFKKLQRSDTAQSLFSNSGSLPLVSRGASLSGIPLEGDDDKPGMVQRLKSCMGSKLQYFWRKEQYPRYANLDEVASSGVVVGGGEEHAGWKHFLLVPHVKFILKLASYFTFLFLYVCVLMQRHGYPSTQLNWLDFLFYTWAFSLFIEELYQWDLDARRGEPHLVDVTTTPSGGTQVPRDPHATAPSLCMQPSPRRPPSPASTLSGLSKSGTRWMFSPCRSSSSSSSCASRRPPSARTRTPLAAPSVPSRPPLETSAYCTCPLRLLRPPSLSL